MRCAGISRNKKNQVLVYTPTASATPDSHIYPSRGFTTILDPDRSDHQQEACVKEVMEYINRPKRPPAKEARGERCHSHSEHLPEYMFALAPLTHGLTHLLTHACTYSLTQSLTHSLTH